MTVGVEARVSGQKTIRAIDRLEEKLERGLVAAMAAAVNAGYKSLKGTTAFQDRTEALRDSFVAHADETPDGEFYVRVDPDMDARRGTAPPGVYGRFVNWGTSRGTSRISPRLFAEEARAEMVEVFEHRVGRLLGGSAAGADVGVDEQ